MSQEKQCDKRGASPAELAHFMAGLFAKCHELEFNGQTLDKMVDVEGYLRDQAALACAPSHVAHTGAPKRCQGLVCKAAQIDKIVCAEGECDFASGVRTPQRTTESAPSTTPRRGETPHTEALRYLCRTCIPSSSEAMETALNECAELELEVLSRRKEAIAMTGLLAKARAERDSALSATRRTHDVLLAINHGYVEWEATGDFDKLVKAINEGEVHRQEIAPPQINAADGGKATS